MRILLVEDDASVSRSIELMLKAESFSLHTTSSGADGTDLGKLYDYDLVILDLDLPDMSGFDVLRSLRRAKVRSPILILSGLSATEEKVKGLGYGADDYLTKPFYRTELIARIHALVRRSKGRADAAIECGDLIVRFEAKKAEVRGTLVPLSEKEFQCLDLLATHPGRTVAKDSFLNHLYGGVDEPDIKIIDVYICKLRRKLAAASGGKDYIETVWGRGYLLREPLQQQLPASREDRTAA